MPPVLSSEVGSAHFSLQTNKHFIIMYISTPPSAALSPPSSSFHREALKCNNSTREKIHFRNFSVPWCRRDLLSGQLGNLSLFSFVCFAPRLNLYPHTSQQAKPPGLEQNNEECGDKHSLSAPFSSKLFFTIFLTDFLLL